MEFIKHVMNHPRFDTVDNGTFNRFPFMKEVGGFSLQSWNKKMISLIIHQMLIQLQKHIKNLQKILGNEI